MVKIGGNPLKFQFRVSLDSQVFTRCSQRAEFHHNHLERGARNQGPGSAVAVDQIPHPRAFPRYLLYRSYPLKGRFCYKAFKTTFSALVITRRVGYRFSKGGWSALVCFGVPIQFVCFHGMLQPFWSQLLNLPISSGSPREGALMTIERRRIDSTPIELRLLSQPPNA